MHVTIESVVDISVENQMFYKDVFYIMPYML